MVHSTHYILELQLQEDKKQWYVYTQGISPLFYRLEGVKHFRIYRQWLENTVFKKKEMTWCLLAFQQLFRRKRQFKKAVMKHLFKLQTGEVTFQQLRLKYL